jgi:hypothetical protein
MAFNKFHIIISDRQSNAETGVPKVPKRCFLKGINHKNENCFVLSPDRDEMSNLYRGPSIDASYQVWIHLVKRFQRRRFFLEINQSETRIACGGHVC